MSNLQEASDLENNIANSAHSYEERPSIERTECLNSIRGVDAGRCCAMYLGESRFWNVQADGPSEAWLKANNGGFDIDGQRLYASRTVLANELEFEICYETASADDALTRWVAS